MNATPCTRIEGAPLERTRAWCRRLRAWLAPRADARLHAVRLDFYRALRHIHTPRASDLAARLLAAQTAADLWHLRSEVFTVVAIRHGEAEARARVQSLNRHFPMRAPMSGFAPDGRDD